MGCSNSKVDNEEGLAICKQRKRLMKQTVTSRHSLAASHAMYVISLKGVGSAFRQFAEGEVKGDGDSHSMYSTTETPNTPRTPPTKLGASTSFSTSPLSPQTRLSALRLHPELPRSVTLDFLPPPPLPITVNPMEHTPPVIPTKIHRFEDSNSSMKSFRMEDDSHQPIQGNRDRRYWGRRSTRHVRGHHAPPPHITVNAMEHTPPVIPTKIHRFEDSNSYMKSYRMEGDSHPPPMMQPIQGDDDWRYSGRRSTQHMRGNNAPPPPPPPVTRSSWQDLFLDPFRPAHVSYNYVDDRRSLDMEAREMERRKSHEHEMMMKRKQEAEVQERRAREMEQKRMHEMAAQHRPPHVKIVDVRGLPLDHGVPDLEEEEIPELEDVDEDIDGPPPPVWTLSLHWTLIWLVLAVFVGIGFSW